jgi:hypothetical protein
MNECLDRANLPNKFKSQTTKSDVFREDLQLFLYNCSRANIDFNCSKIIENLEQEIGF